MPSVKRAKSRGELDDDCSSITIAAVGEADDIRCDDAWGWMEENEELFGASNVGALFELDAMSGEFGSEYFDFSMRKKTRHHPQQ